MKIHLFYLPPSVKHFCKYFTLFNVSQSALTSWSLPRRDIFSFSHLPTLNLHNKMLTFLYFYFSVLFRGRNVLNEILLRGERRWRRGWNFVFLRDENDKDLDGKCLKQRQEPLFCLNHPHVALDTTAKSQ